MIKLLLHGEMKHKKIFFSSPGCHRSIQEAGNSYDMCGGVMFAALCLFFRPGVSTVRGLFPVQCHSTLHRLLQHPY